MFNKTNPSYFEGEWTFEKTEHAILGLCKTLNRYAHKLTLEDLQNDPRCAKIPHLSLDTVQEVIRDVEDKLWRGVEHPLIRATHGLIFLKEMNVKEFVALAEAMRIKVEQS